MITEFYATKNVFLQFFGKEPESTLFNVQHCKFYKYVTVTENQ